MLSGTYIGASAAEENVKTYSHQMFTSIYDYPYLSSSSNHLMDITMGFPATNDDLSQSSPPSLSDQKKKINVYNQMAQLLSGYDTSGSILPFDEDGDVAAGGAKINAAFFINFSRLLTKDEIKKGSFEMEIGLGLTKPGGATDINGSRAKITDLDATSSYKINSPAGEYGILWATSSGTGVTGDEAGLSMASNAVTANNYHKCGLIFYQAGIAVLTASMFTARASQDRVLGISAGHVNSTHTAGVEFGTGSAVDNTITGTMVNSTIQENTNFLRGRIYNISFNNTTELNSTIHFCRANHNEFNYSSNPSYLETTGSKIAVKDSTLDNPVTYITTIGLYSTDNELLAVAKLSEPIKKDPQTELTFRVRLDY